MGRPSDRGSPGVARSQMKKLLLVVLLLIMKSAYATIPFIGVTPYNTGNGKFGDTVAAVCAANSPDYVAAPVTPSGCACGGSCVYGTCSYNSVVKLNVFMACGCPSGSHYVSSPYPSCVCDAGFEEVNGQCQAPCEADQVRNPTTGQCEYDCSSKAGQIYDAGGLSMPSGGNACDANCQLAFVETHPCIYIATGAQGVGLANEGYCTKYRYTGVSGACTSTTAPPEAEEQDNCKGKCTGTVNGSKVCVPCTNNGTSTSAEGGTTTTVSPDGSTVEKKTTVTTSTTGGVTTKTTTTTTTTTPAGGGTPTTTTETQTETYPAGEGNPTGTSGSGEGFEDKNDVLDACKERPDLPICRSICKENPEYSMCKELGEPSDDQPALERKTIGTESITATPGFGMCPGDIALPHGATLSMTWVCNLATEVKPFFIAMAWIAAGLIVMGGFKGAGQ